MKPGWADRQSGPTALCFMQGPDDGNALSRTITAGSKDQERMGLRNTQESEAQLCRDHSALDSYRVQVYTCGRQGQNRGKGRLGEIMSKGDLKVLRSGVWRDGSVIKPTYWTC